MKTIYFAGGCFWGVEKYFSMAKGVINTEVGYANGTKDNPSYLDLKHGLDDASETVKIDYDEQVISLEKLLELYLRVINPYSLNKQGEDEGVQYRTGIYYTDAADLPKIHAVYEEEQQKTAAPFVVEVKPLENFYRAEDDHQDYLNKNPDGYCHLPLELFRFAREARPERD